MVLCFLIIQRDHFIPVVQSLYVVSGYASFNEQSYVGSMVLLICFLVFLYIFSFLYLSSTLYCVN